MSRRIDYRCKTCGSNEMAFDATAEWDADLQNFVVGTTYDTGWCNSETCQGEERSAFTCDAETGEELRQPPGSFDYIPKPEADVLWKAEQERWAAERAEREQQARHDAAITETVETLASAYEEITA
ncbi:MAG: hypothetical protein F4X83_12290 [Chloroflexi bacterium]|nr:hypothetical protein [Chloroflexota bacterium]